MKKKKFSIHRGGILLAAAIVLLLETLLFSAEAMIFSNVKNQLIDKQQEQMQMFVDQLEIRTDYAKTFLLQEMGEYYTVWRKSARGEIEYEHAKQTEKSTFESQINGIYQGTVLSDGMIAWISGTGESIDSRRSSVPLEDFKELKAMLQQAENDADIPEGYTVVTVNGREYLVYLLKNAVSAYMTFICMDTICEEWNAVSDWRLDVALDGRCGTDAAAEQIEVELLDSGSYLSCQIPKSAVYRGISGVGLAMCVILVAIGVGVLAVFGFFRKIIVRPLEKMQDVIERNAKEEKKARLSGCETVQELAVIQDNFNEMLDNIYALKIRNYEMEIENQKAQLVNLQLQINPHLLLNSLNTVYGLSEIEDYHSIQKFTMNLVKYFRYSLKDTNELVPMRQELEFIDHYIEIQKIRYPGTFDYIYNVDEELLDFPVLPLLIQNFVENSIKHGPKTRRIFVVVSARKTEHGCGISICDDGDGIAPEICDCIREGRPYEKDGEVHVGIWNCMRRMKLFYGDRAKFTVNAEGGGTQIYIELPDAAEGSFLERGEAHENTDYGR